MYSYFTQEKGLSKLSKKNQT